MKNMIFSPANKMLKTTCSRLRNGNREQHSSAKDTAYACTRSLAIPEQVGITGNTWNN